MQGHVDILGHPTWIEDDGGDGEPVVLLHGAYGANEPLLSIARNALDASRHRVLAFERRGHGRTADTEAPFGYVGMARETEAVLQTVVGGPAHLVGFSDGANAILELARLDLGLVRTMTLIGGNFDAAGLLTDPTPFEPGAFAYEITKAAYAGLSPDGEEHFPTIFEKAERLMREEPHIPVADLRAMTVPALVIVGDDDVIDHRHTLELYDNLPQARLAVVPGASHLVPLEKPSAVGALLAEFLADPSPPQTLDPIRRA